MEPKKSTWKIEEHPGFLDAMKYLFIVVTETPPDWFFWIVVMKIFGAKNSKLTVVKTATGKIVGGYFITSLSLGTFKPFFWFNKKAKVKLLKLEADGYKYFSCFVVTRMFRNLEIGTTVYNKIKEKDQKIYYIPTQKAKNFYLRNGARVYFESKHSIYINY